jgi:hypothetical protein
MIDSAWYMFDPTWGSGYCSIGRFFRQIDDEYFKASPDAFVRSQMPFDPLCQFLDYTVTNQELYDGYVQPASTRNTSTSPTLWQPTKKQIPSPDSMRVPKGSMQTVSKTQ